MDKNELHLSFRVKGRLVVFVILIGLSAVFSTSCLMMVNPMSGSTGSDTDIYGLFRFFSEQGTQVSGPLTPPATFIVDFQYRGRLPVRSLEISAIRSSNEHEWFHQVRGATRHATTLFDSGMNADTFIFYATVTTIGQQIKVYEDIMRIIDTTPPTIVQIDFYLTDHDTLVPNTTNDVYIWIHLHDPETLLFAPDIRNTMERHTRLFVNGRLVQSFFNPDDIFVTGSANRMIAIIRTALDDLKPGNNSIHLIMGGFGLHEEQFTEFQTEKTAEYPDHTPPVILFWEAVDTDPGDHIVDFVAFDSFIFRVRARDLPDHPTFPPAGLKEIRWRIDGGPSAYQGIVDAGGFVEAEFSIFMDPRNAGFSDGIYSLRLEVWDKNDNVHYEPPIFFRLGITQSKTVDLLVEKIRGNLLIPEFRVGDTLRFMPDTDWYLTSPHWGVIPSSIALTDQGVYALLEDAPMGNHTITLQAHHQGIPVFGRTQITVLATPVSEDAVPPTIEFRNLNVSEPGQPFKIVVRDETMLEEDWRDTFVRPPSAIMWPAGTVDEPGTPYPLLVLFHPDAEYNASRFLQVFEIVLNDMTMGGIPPVLRPGDRIVFTVEVKDKRGNTAEKGITFIP